MSRDLTVWGFMSWGGMSVPQFSWLLSRNADDFRAV